MPKALKVGKPSGPNRIFAIANPGGRVRNITAPDLKTAKAAFVKKYGGKHGDLQIKLGPRPKGYKGKPAK